LVSHKTYRAIVEAVKKGKLKEPFTSYDLMKACPELNPITCKVFLPKHRKGNPGNNSELFDVVITYKLIRPYKYDL